MGIFDTEKSYIEYDNRNSMWNDGYIYVYIKNELIETIDVEEYLENNTDEDVYGPSDIIDLLKEKYSIKKVIRDEHNWR